MHWLELLNFVLDYAADGSKHFLLASFAGFLAFWSTWTILWLASALLTRLFRRKISMGSVYGILICSLLLGFALALISHYYLDYFATWYMLPLGLPLELHP